MKIALIGPGYGHNIIPYLIYFDKQNKHQVDFYYHNNDNFSSQFKNLKFFSIPTKLIHLFFNAHKYDIIWLMGGGDYYILLPY